MNKSHSKKDKIDFAVGGQAVIEGVMMRSPNFVATSVRKKNGKIKTKQDPFQSIIMKYKLLSIPLVRGVVNLVEMMIVGMHSVNFSANEFVDEDEEEKEEEQKNGLFEMFTFIFSIFLSLALAVFLFKFVPLAITEFLRTKFVAIENNYILFNLIDGTIRIVIFFTYITLLSQLKDFRRVFEYHGAEHKSIYTYEKDLPLTVENARKQSRFHPRCGTSFIIIILLISIAVYTFVPRDPVFLVNFFKRLAVLPLIAALGYEFLKWSAKNESHFLVRYFVKPGLLTQHITTKEPDDEQLEVALAALKATLTLEESRQKEKVLITKPV